MLEDLVKVHEEDSEYYKIPGLGKHYSIKWAQEDLLEEQKESAKLNDKRRGLNNSSSLNATDSDKLLKKAEKEWCVESPHVRRSVKVFRLLLFNFCQAVTNLHRLEHSPND